VVAICLIYLAL